MMGQRRADVEEPATVGDRPLPQDDAAAAAAVPSTIRVVLGFLGPYKRTYGALTAVMIAASFLESLSLAAFFPLFSSLTEGADPPRGIVALVARGVEVLPIGDPIIAASVALGGLFIARAGVTVLREAMSAHASARVLFDVKTAMMERYAGASYQFFLERKQGGLVYAGLVAPHKVAQVLLRVPQMAAEGLRVLAVGAVLVSVFPVGAAILGVLGLLYFRLIRHLSKRISYNMGKGRVRAGVEEAVITNEFFNGIVQIISFGTGRRWLDRFRRETRTYSDLYAKDLVWLAIPKALMELAALLLMIGAVLAVRAQNPGAFVTALPQIGVIAMGVLQLLPAVTSVGRMRMEVLGALPDAEQVRRALREPIGQRRRGGTPFPGFRNEIAFRGVRFAHPGRDPVLLGVDLVIERGTTTAIVGPSGGGKTTIVKLVTGLLEPTGGAILVDGVPLSDYEFDSWLGRIGLVTQDPFIFHSTIEDNITFRRPGYSHEQVVEAARMAHAHDFIEEFPDGYDTVVGERGMKLSGGQQQRLCIARALLSKPEILIFDEATSSLDRVSESLIQETITAIARDHTVMIVAHRPTTVAGADKIVVLEDGHIVEEGIHRELLENGRQYARLFAATG